MNQDEQLRLDAKAIVVEDGDADNVRSGQMKYAGRKDRLPNANRMIKHLARPALQAASKCKCCTRNDVPSSDKKY